MNKLAVIVLLVSLAACNKKKEEEGREPAQTAAPGPVVGSAAPPAPSPSPQTPAPAPAPAAAGNPAAGGGAAGGSTLTAYNADCADKTPGLPPLSCDVGQIDGCASGVTAVHVCVAKDAKAGAPCAGQPVLTCPAGQADACVHNPQQANTHVCVFVPKSTP